MFLPTCGLQHRKREATRVWGEERMKKERIRLVNGFKSILIYFLFVCVFMKFSFMGK